MVCLGNICRSPMAKAVASDLVAKARLGDKISIESYGTAGYHRGEGADPRAEAALKKRGWSVPSHQARQITVGAIKKADLILCADRGNLRALMQIAPNNKEKIKLLRSFDPESTDSDLDVPDPYYGGEYEFDRTLRIIERSCNGLLTSLAKDSRGET